MGPLVTLDFDVVQGDAWSVILPAYFPQPTVQQPIPGWSADFSLRQNFGDASPLISFVMGTPTANGSNVVLTSWLGVPSSALQYTVRGADTLALSSTINLAQKTTRLFFQCRGIPPGADPVTIVAGVWYLRTKA